MINKRDILEMQFYLKKTKPGKEGEDFWKIARRFIAKAINHINQASDGH